MSDTTGMDERKARNGDIESLYLALPNDGRLDRVTQTLHKMAVRFDLQSLELRQARAELHNLKAADRNLARAFSTFLHSTDGGPKWLALIPTHPTREGER